MIARGARGLGGGCNHFPLTCREAKGWIWIRFGMLPGVRFRDVLPDSFWEFVEGPK